MLPNNETASECLLQQERMRVRPLTNKFRTASLYEQTGTAKRVHFAELQFAGSERSRSFPIPDINKASQPHGFHCPSAIISSLAASRSGLRRGPVLQIKSSFFTSLNGTAVAAHSWRCCPLTSCFLPVIPAHA